MIEEIPIVSVCVPTYNGAKFLQEALDSVKNQSYQNIEVIISDNASVDETLSIAEHFKNHVSFPVRILHHKPNGIGENWNHCIKNAKGDFIKFLFQDDTLGVDCIQKMVEIALANNAKTVACKRNLIIENENQDAEKIERWVSLFGDLQKDLDLEYHHQVTVIDKNILGAEELLIQPLNKIGEPIVMLIHKDIFTEIGYFSTELKQILDFEYWYRILEKFPIYLIDSPLVNFRIHFAQTTMVNDRDNLDEFEVYKDFLNKNFRNFLHPKTIFIIDEKPKYWFQQKLENVVFKIKNLLK